MQRTQFQRALPAPRMGVKAAEAYVEGKGIDYIPLIDVISNKRKVNMEYYHMAKVLAR